MNWKIAIPIFILGTAVAKLEFTSNFFLAACYGFSASYLIGIKSYE